jgi:hypothetical protein
MSDSKRRVLELVYSNDRPVGVVQAERDGAGDGRRDPAEEVQAIERFLTYLYGELRTLDKSQSARLVGAAILALRDEADGNDRSRG